MSQSPSIDRLLNLVPDSPNAVLEQLRRTPDLASKQDGHGYSLLHAATSYGHVDLLRALVQEFHVDVNITDEDDETCLFNAESVDFARELIALGVDTGARNADGQTAAAKLDDEDEQPEVAEYLKALTRGEGDGAATTPSKSATNGDQDAGQDRPPPLPNGVQVNIGTMQESEVGAEPDAMFRRRIEELAARQDFEGNDSQRELRDLITDAVSGMATEDQAPPTSRRRMA